MYICMYRLGEGKKQNDGPMAKYNCVGNEQNLNDCSWNVDENACQLPASSIIACSKLHYTLIKKLL